MTDYDNEIADHTNTGFDQTDDEITWGVNAWVYCRDHCKPHKTGWCSVPNSRKVGLGVQTYNEALTKCQLLDLPMT